MATDEEPPKLQFPWTPFTNIPSADDFSKVHLCVVVSDIDDVTETQRGDLRMALRLKDAVGRVVDVVAWKEHANMSSWMLGKTVQIYYAQVNRERCCVEVNSDSRIWSIATTVSSMSMSTQSNFLEWSPQRRKQ